MITRHDDEYESELFQQSRESIESNLEWNESNHQLTGLGDLSIIVIATDQDDERRR